MASILFADLFASCFPQLEEAQAIQSVAAHLKRNGHQVDVAATLQQVLERLRTEAPDLLVTDMLPFSDGIELVRELERQEPSRRTGVLVLASIEAEAGSALALSRQFSHLIDGYVIRPYCFRVTPEQQRVIRIYLPFQEQLVVSIGHILYRSGQASD